jgi:hypothetical protein
MALVRAVASGLGPAAAVAAATPASVPAYRFSFVFRKAQELADKVRQFGADLLAVLEKRDAEELSRLQGRQETVILAMTRAVKEAQLYRRWADRGRYGPRNAGDRWCRGSGRG